MKLLIYALIIWLCWPLIKRAYYWLWDFIARKIFGKVASAFGGGTDGEQRQRSKGFSKDDGEYVEFEEIAVERDTAQAASEAENYAGEQVSDAQFEDIYNE